MAGGEHLVGNVVWFSAPGMIFLLDRGGWSFSWKFCVILSSRYDISIGWRGGDHTVGNNMWFSAPGMIFLLDRGGWSFSLKFFAILCSRYEIYIGGSGVVIFCVLRFKHHFLLNEHPLYPIELSYLELRITHHFQLNDHSPPSNRNIIPGAENHTTFPTVWLPPPSNRIVIPGAENHTTFPPKWSPLSIQ